jgi:hypothetical protein
MEKGYFAAGDTSVGFTRLRRTSMRLRQPTQRSRAPDILRMLCEQLAADGVINGKDPNGPDLGSALKGHLTS